MIKRCLLSAIFIIALITAKAENPIKILSLNNSLIDYNDQPAMFNEIAQSMGVDARWEKRTQLGRTLLFHYNDPVSKAVVSSQPWDYIILQEQSSLPRENAEVLMESVKLWKLFIMENCPNKDVKIIVPMNWAYSTDWSSFAKDTKRLKKSYKAVERDLPGVVVNYIGQAYQDILDDKGPEYVTRMFSDDRHPTPMASYLAACMEYGLITGLDPARITYVPQGIDKSDAEVMRKAASKTLSLRHVCK